MQFQIPLTTDMLTQYLRELRIDDPGTASIREIRRLIDHIEASGAPKFVRMEMGIPGLPTPEIAIQAEIDALRNGVTALYPPAAGVATLKSEMARFVRLFLDIGVEPHGCLPTVGSLNGSFLTFLVAGFLHEDKDTVLFLDPGFPVHRQQARTLGLQTRGIDIVDSRGPALEAALEETMADGRVTALLYSNPNNPTWMCLTEEELQIIARVAGRHNVLIVEDLAYFGMDFRLDLGRPGEPPYQSTVVRYTNDYILLISSSKAFSYAGQRVGMLIISDALYAREFPPLKRRFPFSHFGDAVVLGALYGSCAGVGHSAQYGLAALLKSANDGEFDFRSYVLGYGKRAMAMKKLFGDHGFQIVYDTDLDRSIADGFYFTLGFPGYTGPELIAELLRYGISAISLEATGATRHQGIRACVSLVKDEELPVLNERLAQFAADHQSA
jgi:aspartate/methionine/tyrosine aminotransferase